MTRPVSLLVVLVLLVGACGDDDVTESATNAPTSTAVAPDEPTATTTATTSTTDVTEQTIGSTSAFIAEVWADNWFSLYINGELVGEDSVPITTERSFNAETISFEAQYPLTIGIVAKDFKENDTGLEYIGSNRQQMGDGGIIVQITDVSTGEVVAVSDATWLVLPIHQAPLNPDCESSADPTASCQSAISTEPAGWNAQGFDASDWTNATEWSEAAVSPKDGYDEIDWDDSAQLIWSGDLEVDNTVLMLAVAG